MKRILHVINSLACGSGMMSLIMNYYRAIDKDEYQFDFLYFDEVAIDYKNEIKMMGGNYYKISKPSFSISFYKEISEFLKKYSHKYYAIHCHPIFSSAYIGIFKKKYNIKYIIQHSHTTRLSSHKSGTIRNKILLDFSKKYITHYIGCSEESLLLISNKELLKKDKIIISNSIDYERFKFNCTARETIRDKYNVLEDTIVIGHVGRFASEKNHCLLIQIFESYHKINKNSKLLLVGNGPLKEKIINYIDELNLTNDTIIIGNVKDVEKYYSAMDLFVFPSIFEGFGLSAIEAQVSGLQVFASKNVPDCTKISHNIFYINGDSVDNYVSAIVKKYKKIDRREIDISDNYDINKNVSKLVDFYNNLGERTNIHER